MLKRLRSACSYTSVLQRRPSLLLTGTSITAGVRIRSLTTTFAVEAVHRLLIGPPTAWGLRPGAEFQTVARTPYEPGLRSVPRREPG